MCIFLTSSCYYLKSYSLAVRVKMIREGTCGDKLLIQVFYNSGTMVDNQLLKKIHIYRIHANVCRILVPLTAFFK